MNIEHLIINADISILEAIKRLDDATVKILLVTDNSRLTGVVTDGDIRRWILKNGSLQEKVDRIMNHKPVYVFASERNKARSKLQELLIEAIPVVNNDLHVIDVISWSDSFSSRLNHYGTLTNPVFIMAGGKGSRLGNYTRVLPKPLIPIDGVPIVERIIDRFAEFGCSRFYMSVNYKKNLIRAYFNDIEDRKYQLDFVQEEKALGTAGSLALVKSQINDTFFLSNCDVLVDGNYSGMLKAHKESGCPLTMITSLKHFSIPYGVIELDENGALNRMIEKPVHDYLVNTGLYIVEPEVIDLVPSGRPCDMDELISLILAGGRKVNVYPVSENSWLDMGEPGELDRMCNRLSLSE